VGGELNNLLRQMILPKRMFKRNWMEIQPILAYDGTCYVRSVYRRRDLLHEEGGYKTTVNLEWVNVLSIPPGREMMYHQQNLEEALYVLQGRGVIRSGKNEWEIENKDTIRVPANIPYTVLSTVKEQPIILASFAVRDPPTTPKAKIEKVDRSLGGGGIEVEKWFLKEGKPGHEGTCWTYPLFKGKWKAIGFTTLMTVSSILGYHRHNTEAIYFVDSGLGWMKVAGEEQELRGGDVVYIPPEMAHRCRAAYPDIPLNVFCCGTAVPFGADTWVEEALQDL